MKSGFLSAQDSTSSKGVTSHMIECSLGHVCPALTLIQFTFYQSDSLKSGTCYRLLKFETIASKSLGMLRLTWNSPNPFVSILENCMLQVEFLPLTSRLTYIGSIPISTRTLKLEQTGK